METKKEKEDVILDDLRKWPIKVAFGVTCLQIAIILAFVFVLEPSMMSSVVLTPAKILSKLFFL
jgi:hypothetical protein